MYNARIYKYASSGYQIRLYDTMQDVKPDEIEVPMSSPLFFSDGKKPKARKIKFMENPFTNEWEYVEDLTEGNTERSLYVSLARTKQNIYYLSRSNEWEWFFTLTFNPEKVDSLNYDEVAEKLHVWLKNARKKCPDMKYLVVPERHKSGRWHFHGIFAKCDGLGFVESGQYTKKNEPIYNIGVYRLGFSTATRVNSTEKVSKYISKYITKDMCESTRGKKRYWASRNLDRAEIEDVILTKEEKDILVSTLFAEIGHIKKKGFDDMNTTYIELRKGVSVTYDS